MTSTLFTPWKTLSTVVFSMMALFLTTNAIASEPYETAQEAEDAVVSLFKRAVKTINHDVFVYHYRPRSRGESLEETQKTTARTYSNYVRKTIYGNQGKSDFRANILGTGLYAAFDPVISRNYGKDDWVLFQIRLKAGTRYLDTVRINVNIPENLGFALGKHFGCLSSWAQQIMSSTECLPLREKILRGLDVTGVEYQWTYAGGLSKELCPGQNGDGFYFTNLKPFRTEDILVFGKETRTHESLRKMIQRTFYFSDRDRDSLWTSKNPGWFESDVTALEETQSWARQNLWGCEEF